MDPPVRCVIYIGWRTVGEEYENPESSLIEFNVYLHPAAKEFEYPDVAQHGLTKRAACKRVVPAWMYSGSEAAAQQQSFDSRVKDLERRHAVVVLCKMRGGRQPFRTRQFWPP